jgi:hypothetical protein
LAFAHPSTNTHYSTPSTTSQNSRSCSNDRNLNPERRMALYNPVPAHPCVYRMGRLEKLATRKDYNL